MPVFLLLNDQYLYLLISVSDSIWLNLYEYLAADLYSLDKPKITSQVVVQSERSNS